MAQYTPNRERDIEKALDSVCPVSRFENPRDSHLTQRHDPQDRSNPNTSVLLRSFSEPIIAEKNPLEAADTASGRTSLTKKQATAKPLFGDTTAGVDVADRKDDVSDLRATYDDKKGWINGHEYFDELVRGSTDVKELLKSDLCSDIFSTDRLPGSHGSTKPSAQALGAERLEPCHVMNKDAGYALTLRILTDMVSRYTKSELRLELVNILETRTTSQEQLRRIHLLLENIHSVRKYETELMMRDIEDNFTRKAIATTSDRGSEESTRLANSSAASAVGILAGCAAFFRKGKKHRAGRPTVAMFSRMQRIDRLNRQLNFKTRFATAILGGLALIVPMLIMAIHPIKKKTLITSSVAVFLFALGVAWKSSAKEQEVLAVTAAYAAVMVVFVGISGP